jgi:hypothetical protein
MEAEVVAQRATTGGDGSTITTSDGSTFTYTNKFGGFCTSFPVFVFLRLLFGSITMCHSMGPIIQCVLGSAPAEYCPRVVLSVVTSPLAVWHFRQSRAVD